MRRPAPTARSLRPISIWCGGDLTDANAAALKLALPARRQRREGVRGGCVDGFGGDELDGLTRGRIVDDDAAHTLGAEKGGDGLDAVQSALDVHLHG